MTISDITLMPPYIILKQYDGDDIQMDNPAIQFGNVQRVYETCDKFASEWIVSFYGIDATPFKVNSEYYFLIDENKIQFKYPYPV